MTDTLDPAIESMKRKLIERYEPAIRSKVESLKASSNYEMEKAVGSELIQAFGIVGTFNQERLEDEGYRTSILAALQLLQNKPPKIEDLDTPAYLRIDTIDAAAQRQDTRVMEAYAVSKHNDMTLATGFKALETATLQAEEKYGTSNPNIAERIADFWRDMTQREIPVGSQGARRG